MKHPQLCIGGPPKEQKALAAFSSLGYLLSYLSSLPVRNLGSTSTHHKDIQNRDAKKIFAKRKRKMAGWNNDYLLEILLTLNYST